MKTDKEIFTEWLRHAIKIKGLIKGKDLAVKAGVDPTTISGYLTGRTKGPELDLRLKICNILNVDYSSIIKQGKFKKDNPQHFNTPSEDVEAKYKKAKKEIEFLKAKLKDTEETLRYAYKGWEGANRLVQLLEDQVEALGGKTFRTKEGQEAMQGLFEDQKKEG